MPRASRARGAAIGLLVAVLVTGCGEESPHTAGRSGEGSANGGVHLDQEDMRWSVEPPPSARLDAALRADWAGEELLRVEIGLPPEEWRAVPLPDEEVPVRIWTIHLDLFRLTGARHASAEELELVHTERTLERLSSPSDPPRPNAYAIALPALFVVRDREEGPPDASYRLGFRTTPRTAAHPLVRAARDERAAVGPVKLEHETRSAVLLAAPARLRWSGGPTEGTVTFGFGMLSQSAVLTEAGLLVDACRPWRGDLSCTVRVGGTRIPLWRGTLDEASRGRYRDVTLELPPLPPGIPEWELRLEAEGGDPAVPSTESARLDHLISISLPFHGLRPAELPENRNVVLVVIDTLRADGPAHAGNRVARTPNLDRLAEQGVCYRRAYTSSPWTLPAQTSLLTSLLPTQHGVVAHGHRIPEELLTLPEVLRSAGWRTVAFADAGFLLPYYGFAQGFDRFFSAPEGVEKLVERACDWLETAPRPFFLFLHTYEVHSPYDPPAEILRELGMEDLRTPIDEGEIQELLLRGEEAPPALVQNARALYDAEITWTDRMLGRLFDKLTELDLDERTLVVVTSDHGEEFLDHGGFGHGISLFEELLRIPLVIRAPVHGGQGHDIDEPVRIEDIAPTICELLDVPVPSSWVGRSLAHSVEPRTILAYSLRALSQEEAWAFVRDGHKYIETSADFYVLAKHPAAMLLDLVRDPLERSPDLDPRVLAPARAELLRLRSRFPSLGLQVRREGRLTAEEEANLRALGYLGDDR